MKILRKNLMIFSMIFLLFTTLSAGAFSFEVFAAEERPLRLIDGADIIDDGKEAELLSMLDCISEKHDCDVIIVTVTLDDGSENSYSSSYIVEKFAGDFYDSHNYGMGENRDGIMLTICMSPRYYDILANGYGDELMSYNREYILDDMYDDMAAGDYTDACFTFAEECEHALVDDKTVGIVGFLVAFGIGAVIALIAVMSMKAQLNSVALKRSAAGYVKQGSLAITSQSDIFLYHTITRTAKPKDTSSGGRSGGGGGRSHGGRSF